jgi:hypothetical protein
MDGTTDKVRSLINNILQLVDRVNTKNWYMRGTDLWA